MNQNEKTENFLKSLFFIALFTVIAMISSKHLVEYYMNHSTFGQNIIEYSSNKEILQEN